MKKELDKSRCSCYLLIMNEKGTWGGRREGSGRKPTGRQVVNITLTLPKKEAEVLRLLAEELGETISQMIQRRFMLPVLAAQKE